MKHILMRETEQIMTATGPLTVKKGSQVVEDWIAASFVGRGLAIEIMEMEEKPLPADDEINFEEMNIGQLRELAMQKNVPGYRKLKREELISALKPFVPPKEPIEVIDNLGGKEPPVFKVEA